MKVFPQLTILCFVQLVYKVKLNFVLEQLASASVGGYGHDVWSELVEEAKTNLIKITVSVQLLGLWIIIILKVIRWFC